MMTRFADLLTQRLPVSVAGGLALVAVSLALIFMWATAGGGPAISPEEAIQTAVAEVEADGVMSLDGRDTVAEQEGGNWHVFFPLAIVPQVIWGDVNCSGDVGAPDAIGVLRDAGGLDNEAVEGCPDVGTIIDPAAICEDASCSTTARGGEPHVIVNGSDASIEDLYYTQ